jgi:hypothetical protein
MGIHDTRELDEHSITRRLHDAPTMLGDFRINKLPPARLQLGERALLVGSHETAVTCDIGRENGR